MKYLKYILFTMVIFLNLNVFAAENVTSKVEALPGFGGGTYTAWIPNNPAVFQYYNFGTRYNGKISAVKFYLSSNDWNWNYNKTYTITMTMATDDWRNNFLNIQVYNAQSNGNATSNMSNCYVQNTFKYVSYRTIKFNFKLKSTMSPYLYFYITSGNINTSAFTGVSNWNLSSISISAVSNSTPTPNPVTPTPAPPTPTPQPNNQDIINNQTQNTQDIINNNNTNTNSIINNNTQNTEDIINNQTENASDIIENANSNTESILIGLSDNQFPDCAKGNRYFIVGSDKSYISDSNGRINNNNNYYVTSPIKINPNESYTMNIIDATGIQYGYYCFYRKNLSVISCTKYSDNTTTSYTFTSPSESYFFRATLYNRDNVKLNATLNGNTCVTGSYQSIYQDSTDEIRTRQELVSIDNSINDSSIDDKTGFFTNFDNNTHGLTGIITLPLSTIQSLANTSCVTLSIPVPFTNDNFTLPCMTQVYESAVPEIYSMWQIVSFGIISYYICLDIFKMVKGFKDPNEDKVEVLDL